jgi:hypothetical protein
MSKRLKNYPDPTIVINKYGADALRMYLINSPVVRAEPLKFKEEGVLQVVKDVFLPWYNAFRFLMQNIERSEAESGAKFVPDKDVVKASTNSIDVWLGARTQGLIKFVHQEMKAYRLYVRATRTRRRCLSVAEAGRRSGRRGETLPPAGELGGRRKRVAGVVVGGRPPEPPLQPAGWAAEEGRRRGRRGVTPRPPPSRAAEAGGRSGRRGETPRTPLAAGWVGGAEGERNREESEAAWERTRPSALFARLIRRPLTFPSFLPSFLLASLAGTRSCPSW